MSKIPLILLCGESGSGKDTIADCLSSMYGLKKILSFTTRKPRVANETTHTFVTDEYFDKIKSEDMVAFVSRNGIRYCATKEQVEKNDIYIIDADGIKNFVKSYCGDRPYVVVYLKVDEKTRSERLLARSPIGELEISDRLNIEQDWGQKLEPYNPIVINGIGTPMEIAREVYEKVKACSNEFDKPLTIYISHPFQDKEENVRDIELIVKKLVVKYPNYTFISPVHTFGFLYNEVSYDKGLNWCLNLLDKCDKMWVYGDYMNSTGCRREIAYCLECNIPYQIMKGEIDDEL